MPSSVAGPRAVEHDDLAPARRRVVGIGGRLAVHAEVLGRLLDQAVRLAGDDEGVVGQADVERLAAAPQREQQLVGARRRDGGDGDRALERGDRRAERLARGRRRRPAGVTTSVGITLASVVISAGIAQPGRGLEVGEVVDVAVERGGDVAAGRTAASSLAVRAGWALASEMMPTLAQRVWPSTVTSARSSARARRRSVVARDRRRAGPRCCRRARRSRPPPCRRTQMRRPADAHRPRAEQRIGAARSSSSATAPARRGRGRGRATSDVEAGRVAARGPRAGRGRTAPAASTCRPRWRPPPGAAGEVGDRPGGAEPVADRWPSARPSARTRRGVDVLELDDPQLVLGVEALVDRPSSRPATRRRRSVDAGRQRAVVEQERGRPAGPGAAGRPSRARRPRRRPASAASRRCRSSARRAERRCAASATARAEPPDDGDDPAHGHSGRARPRCRLTSPRRRRDDSRTMGAASGVAAGSDVSATGLGDRARRPRPARSRPRRPSVGVVGLDHDPHQGFGAAGPEQHPAGRPSSASAPTQLGGHRGRRGRGSRSATSHVPQHLGQRVIASAARSARGRPARRTRSSSCRPVSRPSPVVARSAEDDVAATARRRGRTRRRRAPRARSGRRPASRPPRCPARPWPAGSRGWS